MKEQKLAPQTVISKSRSINKSPEIASKTKRDNSRNMSTAFARIFDKDTVDLYSKKLDEELKKISEVKNELVENGRELLQIFDALNTKAEHLGLRAELSGILKELHERAMKGSRLQAGMLMSSNNLVKTVTERETILKKKVVMVVMTLDDKIDKLKKDLERATAENKSPRKIVKEKKEQSSRQMNLQQAVSAFRQIIDHKEAEIKKLKSTIWTKQNFFKINYLSLLAQRQNLIKSIEFLSENANTTYRPLECHQSDKHRLDLNSDAPSSKLEAMTIFTKGNDQNLRVPKSPFPNTSLKSVSVYGSYEKDSVSLRTDRTSARTPKDLKVIIDRKYNEIYEKLENARQNSVKISQAETAIAELTSELSVYLNNHPDKNHKTWKSMISLKEGQIQLKRNAIEDLQKQNSLLRKDIEILKKEMLKVLSINKQKLKALAFNTGRAIDALREQYRGNRKMVFELQGKAQVNKSRRTIGLSSQFKELCAVNSTITSKHLENLSVDKLKGNVSGFVQESGFGSKLMLKAIEPTIKSFVKKIDINESPDYSKRSLSSVKKKEFENMTLQKSKMDQNEQRFELFKTKISNLIERDTSDYKLEAELVSSLFSIKQKLNDFAENAQHIKTNIESLKEGIENLNAKFSNEVQMRIRPYLLNSSLEDLDSTDTVLNIGQKLVDLVREMTSQEIQVCEKISHMEIEIAKFGDFKGIKGRLDVISKERREGLKSLLEVCNFTVPSLDNFHQKGRISHQMNVYLSEKLELKEKKISQLLKRVAELERASEQGHRATSRSTNSVIPRSKDERNKSKNPLSAKSKTESKVFEDKLKRSNNFGGQVGNPMTESTTNDPLAKTDQNNKQINTKYEEQIEYLLAVIASYEKAFDAFKKEQDLEAEQRRIRYRLKSEELEMALSKMDVAPDANFLHQYAANSFENLNSFKEISENLQANISSLKIISLKATKDVDTGDRSSHPNGLYTGSDKFIFKNNRAKRSSEDFSHNKHLYHSLDFNSIKMKDAEDSGHPISLKEFYNSLASRREHINQLDPKTRQMVLGYLSFIGMACRSRMKTVLINVEGKMNSMSSAILKLKNSLSKIKAKVCSLSEEKDSYKRTADSFKSHTLAMRLKEQSQKNTELSDFLFKVAQTLTKQIPQVKIDDLTPDVLLTKLEDGLNGYRQANSKLNELQMRSDDLHKKNQQLTTDLEEKVQENTELSIALESEILRADSVIKHHEQDRQTLRKQLLQLTQEKVELEEKNDYYSKKIEILQNDLRDQKKSISNLYETLYQYQSAGHRDFSFAESLKRKEENVMSTSKFSPSEADDMSFEDIASRFMKKEINSDFLNEGSSEKFIKQYDEAKIDKIDGNNNRFAFKKTDSVLEELYEEDKRTQEKDKLKEMPTQDTSRKNSDPIRVPEENIFQQKVQSDNSNPFDRLIERKVIDFDLNSEQSIRHIQKTESEHFVNIKEEAEEFNALFQPKYLKESELDSYREVETEMPEPTPYEGTQLISFKQLK